MVHTYVVIVRGVTQDMETTGQKIQHILESCSESKLLVEVKPVSADVCGDNCVDVSDEDQFAVFTQAEFLR